MKDHKQISVRFQDISQLNELNFRDTPTSSPSGITSNKGTAFLLAGIQIFNHDETMARYLERCWRIVKHVGTTLDIELTVVYACLGNFMKNVKKNASKVLTKKQVKIMTLFRKFLIKYI